MSELPIVTQADRDAATLWRLKYEGTGGQSSLIQMFARHRIASNTEAADAQEALQEALFGLSARLLLSGFLDDADNHAAYEKVVAANAALAKATQ